MTSCLDSTADIPFNAELCRLSVDTVYKWIEHKRMTAHKASMSRKREYFSIAPMSVSVRCVKPRLR